MTRSPGQRLRHVLGVRLGVFDQHSPVPLSALRLPPVPPLPLALPRIALVTPSFNQGQFIGRTIESVLAQGYPALDYVIQDGGSIDSTAEALAPFVRRLTVISEADAGQADAINRGFARSDAPIMGWVNSDDLLLPGTLARVAAIFTAHPEIDAVYGNRLIVDERDQVIGAWVLPRHDADVLRRVDYVPQETLFWRRSIWEAAGGSINTALDFAIDWDLLLRFLAVGCRFRHVAAFLGAFRIHAAQKTSVVMNSAGRAEIARLRQLYAPPAGGLRSSFAHAVFLFDHRRAHRRAWAEVAP